MAKEQVDMETLVHWAYGRQKAHMSARFAAVHCGPQAHGSAWLGFARLLELGTLKMMVVARKVLVAINAATMR